MFKNARGHVWRTLAFALIHFLIWLVVLWQEIGHAIAGMWGSRVTGHSDYIPSPLYTALSFPIILLPNDWHTGTAGIALFVVNSLLWGIALDVLLTLIWLGISSLVSRMRPATQSKED
jgi:hypothetical protein